CIVLLTTINTVGKLIVYIDTIELRGGQILLRAPASAFIKTNGSAAIIGGDHVIGVVRIDP
ncbi:hypothetical protein ABTG69_19855, partial [Acinetobacter baumannii]